MSGGSCPTLAHGDSAPVVIYLHGFRASAPDLYWEHIHHLTRQGIIVVFPRINKGGPTGLFTDNDQPAMITRAVESSRLALDELGPRVSSDEVYLFGHSLGGLIGACWHGYNGPEPKAILLAHPSVSLDRIPAFARRFITPADWRTHAAVSPQRTVILGGDKDTLVPVHECVELAGEMKQAESCSLHITQHDEHGVPPIPAGHLATVRADSPAVRWLGHVLGGNEGDDTLHSRFYYAALDAVIAGEDTLEFEMGSWSDGQAVLAPTLEFDSRRNDERSSKRRTVNPPRG
ncbi:MAG: alpha/beta hydrolase [Microthrixaceae bacterium]